MFSNDCRIATRDFWAFGGVRVKGEGEEGKQGLFRGYSRTSSGYRVGSVLRKGTGATIMPPFQNDVGCTPPSGPKIFPGDVSEIGGHRHSQPTLVAEQVFAAVMTGLEDAALFPPIDIVAAENLGSLAKVKTSPAVKSMVALLEDVDLVPQVGYNPSSGRISFTVPLQKQIKGVSDPRQAVVWCMLGLLPWQRQVEKLFAECEAKAGGHIEMLANRCLAVFAKQANVCVVERRIDCARGTLRAELGKSNKRGPGAGFGAFVYSPSYLLLSGYSEADAAFRDEVTQEGRSALVQSMVEDFWKRMEETPYLPSPELREQVGAHVHAYCVSGIKDQSANFRPQPCAHLYLHGGAGAGKSSFVNAFAESLQGMIRRTMDPERRVSVVKVSLNAVTPQYLRSVLCVRGLSDFSIERMVEQTLCKGHTVVLHMEEVPEDLQLQAELYDIICIMLGSLKKRYPENFGNMVVMFTSNYQPHEKLREHSLVLCVRPPPRECQEHCCKMVLKSLVKGGTEAHDVSVSLCSLPHLSSDMRPLRIWWTSMAYHISRHVALHSAAPRRVYASLTSKGTASGADGALPQAPASASEAESPNSACFPLHVTPAKSDAAGSTGVTETHVELVITEDVDGGVVGRQGGAGVKKQCAFDLVSDDGFLQHERTAAHVDVQGQAGHLHKAQTVVDMCVGGYLKPGVVLLSGCEAQVREREKELLGMLRERCGEGQVLEAHVSLREEADSEKVHGKASQIRGGLFKLIDDFNNSNNKVSGGVCVIVCQVNEAGQYMLRELLDSGEVSKTHRHTIRKDGVVFIVSVDEGAEVQDMMLSRTHYKEVL